MLDEDNQVYYGKSIIRLSEPQAKVLGILIDFKGKIATYRDITMYVWGKEPYRNPQRLVGYHVQSLNRLLKGEVVIKNKRTIGWYIET